jgi:hypothetical protein
LDPKSSRLGRAGAGVPWPTSQWELCLCFFRLGRFWSVLGLDFGLHHCMITLRLAGSWQVHLRARVLLVFKYTRNNFSTKRVFGYGKLQVFISKSVEFFLPLHGGGSLRTCFPKFHCNSHGNRKEAKAGRLFGQHMLFISTCFDLFPLTLVRCTCDTYVFTLPNEDVKVRKQAKLSRSNALHTFLKQM